MLFLKIKQNDNFMNILTTYFTASHWFTFVREGTMHAEYSTALFIYLSIFTISALHKRRL